jgi:hypothetical protein
MDDKVLLRLDRRLSAIRDALQTQAKVAAAALLYDRVELRQLIAEYRDMCTQDKMRLEEIHAKLNEPGHMDRFNAHGVERAKLEAFQEQHPLIELLSHLNTRPRYEGPES